MMRQLRLYLISELAYWCMRLVPDGPGSVPLAIAIRISCSCSKGDQVNQCCGWMGRIFGHKMVRFCVKDKGPTPEQIAAIDSLALVFSNDRVAAVRLACTTTYAVCCSRCGAKEKA